jgi:hypothetical protein
MAMTAQDEVILETRIRGLVTQELLDDARSRPEGPHSRELIEVLDFVRRNPDPELPRYLIVLTPEGFATALRNPDRGSPPMIDRADRFETRDAAEHAVLIRRLEDYGVSW